MRKQTIDPRVPETSTPNERWLDLEALAEVEVTSEDPAHPIESALISDTEPGWRANTTGEQTIRLLFREPQTVKRIDLIFHEELQQRTQEFVLQWSAAGNSSRREIVRQQYTFSPPATTTEHESYHVDLVGLSTLELIIDPDRGNGPARASLERLRLA